MILFENNIIKLDYNPATDILEARYPDLHDNLLPEIKHSIDILVDTVKNYDVKNLMLDSTRTVFAVSAEESREIAVYMATGLSRTRLQRLARVRAINSEVETRAKGTMQHFKETGVLTFDLKSFPSTTDALQWLKEHNS